MIRIKTFIWLIILISAFNLNLFPYISSQVSGYVRDKETNTALENVDVYLMSFFRNDPIALPAAQTKTDENGYFIFDDVRKGTYFIECTKDGYEDFSPGYLAELPNGEKYVKTFYIEEGVVKHFEIEMVKGGCLKVIIKKRDDNGVSGYGDIEFSLFAVVKDEQLNRNYICGIARFKTNEDGIRIIDGLHPDIIHGISIRNEGFTDFDKEGIIIKRNETVEVTHLFDFTDKTGISGSITFSDKPLTYAGILLINLTKQKSITDLDIHHKSSYLFRNLEAGNYVLYVYVTYKNEKGTKIELPVVVEKNKTTIKDLKL